MTRWIPWALASLGLVSLGCSKPVEGGIGGSGSTSTGGGAGTTTSTGPGGAGGGGGEGTAGPCGIDCSTIQVPQCFQGICDVESGSCVVVPTTGGEACDDGSFCTVGETCSDGACGGGAENTCGVTPGECEVVLCSEAGNSCAVVPKADGAVCTADDLCQLNATCQAGQCVGTPKDCFFAPLPDSCKVAVCNPATGQCEPEPGNEGAPCSDSGDLCMTEKTCQGGLCLGGTPKSCDHLSVGCVNGLCDPGTGQCYAQPVQPGETCLQAQGECQVGVCAPTGQCVGVLQADGDACDDGDTCTFGETCLGYVCQGGQAPGRVIYFSEDFSDNSAGWTFAPGVRTDNSPIQEWAIGPAMASSGTHHGNHDPAADTTRTPDNGIAGVVIGGYASKVSHTMNYLESPTINTSSAPGSVYLHFRRWLNSDIGPTYMVNTIEVFNGSTWTVVWESGGVPYIYDAYWKRISHDVTAFKSANMRVRFGFRVGSTLVQTVGSWNIDDVRVTNQSCN